MNQKTVQILQNYYDAFNIGDMERFFELLSEDVIHDINQGKREIGKDKFRKFMERMNQSYREKISDIVILTNESGDRAAVERIVEGTYLSTDQGLPPAKNQKYRLAVGAFFSISHGKITRITSYYNLNEWLSQIRANTKN